MKSLFILISNSVFQLLDKSVIFSRFFNLNFFFYLSSLFFLLNLLINAVKFIIITIYNKVFVNLKCVQ